MDPEGVGYVGRGGGHHPDRRPQHDELLAAQGSGPGQERRCPEARDGRDDQELLLSADTCCRRTTTVILCERGSAGSTPPPATCSTHRHSGGAQAGRTCRSSRPVARHGSQGEACPMARAAVAAGRTASMVEVHPNPEQALSGRGADLFPDQFAQLDARGPRDRRGDRPARRGAGVGGGVNPGRTGLTDGRADGYWLLAAAVLSAGPPIRQSADPWPILDRASAPTRRLRASPPDFVQLITNPMIGTPDTTRGSACTRCAPVRLRCGFTAPKGIGIVAGRAATSGCTRRAPRRAR